MNFFSVVYYYNYFYYIYYYYIVNFPTPDEYKQFLDRMWEKFNKYKYCGTRFALKDHLWSLYLYERGLFTIDDVENPDDFIIDGCHCGISYITTLSDGTVYACRRCESPVGKVPEESIYDIFYGKKNGRVS